MKKEKAYKITKPIRLIELFAGIGSQAKALKNIGVEFEHYRVIEIDKYAIASYNAIHDTNFKVNDITKINDKDLEIVDTDKYEYIMTYSFPCQDLSIAGKLKGMKKGDNTRSGLIWEVERLLNECKELPQILLMENVPQVIGKRNIQDFHKWQLFLEKLGYSNYVDLLNAKNYGIPQSRNRCFMVSVLGDYYYEFPHKRKLKLKLKDMLDDEVDEKYYLSDKMIVCDVEVVVGSTRKNAAKNYDGVCPTLTSAMGQGGGNVPMHNYNLRNRKLTPKECWRLMGFDDEDFEKAKNVNSNSQLYKQAGNSIVVKVLEKIFKNLL